MWIALRAIRPVANSAADAKPMLAKLGELGELGELGNDGAQRHRTILASPVICGLFVERVGPSNWAA